MRGVVFLGDRDLELMEFPDPTPGDGEVVIEMKASGMCGSDLHQYRRPKGGEAIGGLAAPTEPVIAGHEPCGIVAAVGPGVPEVQAKIGQRVMVHHYKGCTVCIDVCPLDVLAVNPATRKAEMKYDECWYCLPCEKDCPTRAIRVDIPYLVR